MESADTNRRMNFVLKVLELMSRHDICDMLNWRCDEEYAPITFWINVNDVFAWGCADGEEINEKTLPELERAINDCLAIDQDSESYGCELFAARIRKMRPQGAAYPENKNLWSLFDECGPKRETGLGNPYKPGHYHSS